MTSDGDARPPSFVVCAQRKVGGKSELAGTIIWKRWERRTAATDGRHVVSQIHSINGQSLRPRRRGAARCGRVCPWPLGRRLCRTAIRRVFSGPLPSHNHVASMKRGHRYNLVRRMVSIQRRRRRVGRYYYSSSPRSARSWVAAAWPWTAEHISEVTYNKPTPSPNTSAGIPSEKSPRDGAGEAIWATWAIWGVGFVHPALRRSEDVGGVDQLEWVVDSGEDCVDALDPACGGQRTVFEAIFHYLYLLVHCRFSAWNCEKRPLNSGRRTQQQLPSLPPPNSDDRRHDPIAAETSRGTKPSQDVSSVSGGRAPCSAATCSAVQPAGPVNCAIDIAPAGPPGEDTAHRCGQWNTQGQGSER